MEENEPRKQGGGAFVTFLLVLIILLLSGLLVYLRYGDVILQRVYQFTDGKYGAETGVTSLPGRNDRTEEAVDGAEAAQESVSGAEEAVEGGEIESEPEEIPVEPEPEPEPEPVVMDYAAAKALPDGITLSSHDFTLRTLGESATIRVTGGSDGPFTWISQNPDVASADDNGKITAVSHGTVNVIVTDGVKKGLCVARMITGTTSTDAKLNVSDFTRTVEEGEYQLKVSGVSAPITWTTEDASVATVDENGLVFPAGKGRTRIRAAWDDGYLICVVRVPG
ncbi:MAG: Ig domain-containing protein [Oscillibacter sp.]|nr:Ig domain-containing protein [Oscillibacter sp.]